MELEYLILIAIFVIASYWKGYQDGRSGVLEEEKIEQGAEDSHSQGERE